MYAFLCVLKLYFRGSYGRYPPHATEEYSMCYTRMRRIPSNVFSHNSVCHIYVFLFDARLIYESV
jgi:hypothetical protein